MSQRRVTNVRLPDNLVAWYFDNHEDPISTTLSELLQIFRDVAERDELYATDEVLAKIREYVEEH